MSATPGPWEWWTSNSMRRLSSKATGRDGDVLSAFIASDGVPCIAVREDDMPLIAAAPEQQAKIDALADALELCAKWMPCAEVRSWPPGFRLRDEALAKARAALRAAGRLP